MSATPLSAYTTLRTEGALLPADILARIASGDTSLGGLEPASYHLGPSEKIGEATNRSWNRLQGLWANFKAERAKLGATDTGTTITRERWLLPLFEELKFGRLQIAQKSEIGGKSYNISHGWQQVPIHLVGCQIDLDHRALVAGVHRSSPHSLVQEFLNRSADHLWGIVSNGLTMRLLRDNISLTRQAYVEFDLESMMDGESYPDFVVLWLLLHQSRFEGPRPEECQLEKWTQAARTEGVRVLDDLRDGVQKAIEQLGRGFLAHPGNHELKAQLRSGSLDKQEYYRQVLRLVYRLLFLFVAEDRDLLLSPDTQPEAQKRYNEYYATSRLRRLATLKAGTRHHDLYCGLKLIMSKLADDGCLDLGLPALGSFLFSHRAIPALNECEISNLHLLAAIRSLAITYTGQSRRIVDFKNLGSEELGSVYESLLELYPEVNIDAGTFELKIAAGSERKKTGSYYTPTSLISCLLDAALDPVLNEATGRPDPERTILGLKVLDPSCGSGHFLIGAAHRLGKRLASVRTGEEEPPPGAQRKAVRDVIGHCIYGVDVNPMAVELCKVALWMESLDAGKPLSFLEHHIQCGNSLIGVTPALLSKGIPDEAFTPLEGDDKELCKVLKQLNRDERNRQMHLFASTTRPWIRLGSLAASLADIETISDDSINAVRQKEQMYEEAIRSGDYLNNYFLADTWCAAFVWRKTGKNKYAITEEVFRRIEHNPHACEPSIRDEIRRLASEYRFFHWHLAFPEVFRLPQSGTGETDTRLAGWSGGFDVVLGNPPWVRQELLKSIKPLFTNFATYCSTADSSVLFLERAVQICGLDHFIGLLTPNKWFRAGYAEKLRRFLRDNTRVHLLVDFGHSHDLFPEEDTFPAACVLETVRHPVRGDEVFRAVRAHDIDRKSTSLEMLIAEKSVKVPHSDLRAERWQLEPPAESELLDRLLATGQTLSAYVGATPLSGIKAGFNEAYYIDGDCRARLLLDDPSCENLIKPFLRGRDVKRWVSQWDGQWHIVIPSSQNHDWPWSNESVEDLAESIFSRTYPTVHSHLKTFEEKLRKRSDKGRFWWELRSCDYYDLFDAPKIVVQCIAYFSQFALDQNGHYLNNKVLFIPTGDLYLLAVLNSRVSWWLINRTFQHMKDGGLSIDVQFLLALPIPQVDDLRRSEIEQVTRELLTDSFIGRAKTEVRLNALIESAFGLSDAERAIIQQSLPLRDPIALLQTVEAIDSKESVPPLEILTKPDVSGLREGAWARPMRDARAETGAMLAGILKTINRPVSVRTIRTAAALALDPRLLVPVARQADAAEWRRVIGSEADPLPTGVLSFAQRVDQGWGAAVRNLRANCHLIEDLSAGTWAPGARLDEFHTAGWPDGRASFVLALLREQSIDTIIPNLPVEVRAWIDAAAA